MNQESPLILPPKMQCTCKASRSRSSTSTSEAHLLMFLLPYATPSNSDSKLQASSKSCRNTDLHVLSNSTTIDFEAMMKYIVKTRALRPCSHRSQNHGPFPEWVMCLAYENDSWTGLMATVIMVIVDGIVAPQGSSSLNRIFDSEMMLIVGW